MATSGCCRRCSSQVLKLWNRLFLGWRVARSGESEGRLLASMVLEVCEPSLLFFLGCGRRWVCVGAGGSWASCWLASGSMMSSISSQVLASMSFLMMRVLMAFLRFMSLQMSTKLLELQKSRESSLSGRRYLTSRWGSSLVSHSRISCRQMVPMSLRIHLTLMCITQMRLAIDRQCTILYVMNCTYSLGLASIRSTDSSSSVSMSLQSSSQRFTAPSSTITSFSACRSSAASSLGALQVYSEQQMDSASCLYLMQDWKKQASCILGAGASAKASNSVWLRSWQLPSLNLMMQKGSFWFILCSSICWISYLGLVWRTYLRKCRLLLSRVVLSLPAWKCAGTSFSKYFRCMNSGLILSSICWLQFCSSRLLYSFRIRRKVGRISFSGVRPGSFTTRPSFRLVWQISSDSPSTNRMSGRNSFSVFAPPQVRPSRSFLNHREASLLLERKMFLSVRHSANCPDRQRWHWHLFCPGRWFSGSMVFSRSRITSGDVSCPPGWNSEVLLCTRLRMRLLKLLSPMDSAGLTLEQSSFRRSGLSSTRQKASSERTSSSKNDTLRHKLQQVVLDNPEEQLAIYFSRSKRRTYFRQVIDDYFQPQPTAPRSLAPPELRRDSATSDSPKRTRRIDIATSQLRFKERQSMLDFGSGNDMSCLPVIAEGAKGQRRPTSEYKPSSLLSIEKDMDESLFYESNKSVLQRSSQSEAIQQCQHYKVVQLRKGGKSVGRSRVFSTGDNQQLLREMAAKRLGMELLWKCPLSNQELHYPTSKSLRELCCSTVEDRNGEETILLIYPTAYYFSLFANQNEELRDIVIALARTVASTQGNIANNQVTLKNVVRVKEKQFLLADWGCAALRESLTIQGRTFSKDLLPLCKSQNKWLLAPEYLAPELLRASRSGSFQQLWEQKGGISACDVWSIGCLIFELVTLVPLGSPFFCAVKGKEERKRGLLGCKLPTVEKILAKQKNFRTLALRGIKEQMRVRKQVKLSEKILQLLPRMLEECPEKRISAEEIMAALA